MKLSVDKNRNLITDVFCNNCDSKDYKDILDLYSKKNQKLVIGGNNPEKLAKNNLLLKILCAKELEIIATREILSEIDASMYPYLRRELLRDRFKEFFYKDPKDWKRVFIALKVLQDKDCGDLWKMDNLRLKNNEILFEIDGATCRVAELQDRFKPLKSGGPLLHVGGNSGINIVGDAPLGFYPDSFITQKRIWKRLDKKYMNHALYVPTTALEREYVDQNAIDNIISEYSRSTTDDLITKLSINDLEGFASNYYIIPSILSDDIARINSYELCNVEDSINNCLGKYACVIRLVNYDRVQMFLRGGMPHLFEGVTPVWNNNNNNTN